MKTIWRVIKQNFLGIALSAALAFIGLILSGLIPYGLISGGVFALIIGMCLNPLINKKKEHFTRGVNFTSKKLLKTAIVLMGVTLSFSQVLEVGKISLIVMCFTLISAFGFGYLFGRLFKMNWKLSSLISAGTGICGGSAIAAISPVIESSDSDVAYAISATFIFDIIMVILFPIIGRAIGMSDMGFGLWAGTAVNDTSSVVAAGFAFSDAAGEFAVIVKLTRTLSIIPIVLIFSFINQKMKKKEYAAALAKNQRTDSVTLNGKYNGLNADVNFVTALNNTLTATNAAMLDNLATANITTTSANTVSADITKSSPDTTTADITKSSPDTVTADITKSSPDTVTADTTKSSPDTVTADITKSAPNTATAAAPQKTKLNLKKIFPYFILLFLLVVGIKSFGILPEWFCGYVATASKFLMMMALGAIGLKTNFKSVAKSGFKPMLHGFIISALVVVVAFAVQAVLGLL